MFYVCEFSPLMRSRLPPLPTSAPWFTCAGTWVSADTLDYLWRQPASHDDSWRVLFNIYLFIYLSYVYNILFYTQHYIQHYIHHYIQHCTQHYTQHCIPHYILHAALHKALHTTLHAALHTALHATLHTAQHTALSAQVLVGCFLIYVRRRRERTTLHGFIICTRISVEEQDNILRVLVNEETRGIFRATHVSRLMNEKHPCTEHKHR